MAVAVASAAVLCAVVAGVDLRLEDPLSSRVIPAEDPYTHMALVKEHIRDGNLDPLYEPGGMYPPGMHVFLAATWAYTGYELYDIILLGPVVFGAIGIIGMGFLLARHHQPRMDALFAGVLAAFMFAVSPEVIFRTTMMSPTAVDMAVLPFFLYGLLSLMLGRLGWAGGVAVMALFLVFSHPWVFGVLGIAGMAFIILSLILPWNDAHTPRISTKGLGYAIGIIGLSFAFALRGCGICGSGFGFVAEGSQAPVGLVNAWMPILFVTILLSGGLMWAGRRYPELVPIAPFRPKHRWLRWTVLLIAPIALAFTLIALVVTATAQGLPPFVDLERNIGIPMMVLGGLGVVLYPFARSPASTVGVALVLTTLPFVVFNPFNSLFWSHRTMVYMLVGSSITAGVAGAALVGAAARAAPLLARRWARPGTRPSSIAMIAPVVLVTIALTGSLYASSPGPYEGGWYRMFRECDFEALEQVAENATAQPDAIIITGDWQSKLILAALAENADRVWFKADFFTSQAERDRTIQWTSDAGRPVYLVIDPYLHQTKGASSQFANDDPWVRVPMGDCEAGKAKVRVYEGAWTA